MISETQQRLLTACLLAIFPWACADFADEALENSELVRGDTWESFARDFIADHCTRCHFDGHSGGDYTRYDDVAEDAQVMRCGLAEKVLDGCEESMPPPRSFPSGPSPPSDEIERIIIWIEAGLPRR